MIFVFFLIIMAINFIADLLVAWLVWLIAPLTGLVWLDNLTYWQTFWTVLVASLIVSVGANSAKASD